MHFFAFILQNPVHTPRIYSIGAAADDKECFAVGRRWKNKCWALAADGGDECDVASGYCNHHSLAKQPANLVAAFATYRKLQKSHDGKKGEEEEENGESKCRRQAKNGGQTQCRRRRKRMKSKSELVE